MAMYDVDGLLLLRRLRDVSQESERIWRDEVAELVREAAEQEGRVFALQYVVPVVKFKT